MHTPCIQRQATDGCAAILFAIHLQTATLYKEGGRLLPKEYTFKVQHVRGSGDGANSSRKTIGKLKLDMSTFCSEETAPVPQEVFLQLK